MDITVNRTGSNRLYFHITDDRIDNAPRNEEENRIYGMKRGLDFIADQQNEITEENLHQLYQTSTGEYLLAEDKLLPDHFYRHDAVYIVGGEES